MITLRPLQWPEDRKALLAFDTSFTTDRIYHLRQSSRAFSLEEVTVKSPLRKVYPLDNVVDSLATCACALVAVDAEEVVGFVALRMEDWNRRAVIEHLYVAPFARRWGVGRTLVEAAINEARGRDARCVCAETQNINFGAVRFYESLGFAWCGLDTSLYDPNEIGADEIALFFSRTVG